MTDDLVGFLFTAGNMVVTPFWVLMVFAPAWRGTAWLARWAPGVVAVALAYAWLVVPMLPTTLPLVANPKMAELLPLLSTREGFVVIWLHVLAMDLFAGSVIYRAARARGQHPVVSGVILICTLLFAPIGVLLYWATTFLSGKPWGNSVD